MRADSQAELQSFDVAGSATYAPIATQFGIPIVTETKALITAPSLRLPRCAAGRSYEANQLI
jgi:hypothetical protein